MNKYLRYAAILRKSREMIATKRHMYICWSLPDTADGNNLQDWVMKQLKPSISYSGWYDRQAGKRLTDDQAREGRLQWLDYMIKLCEKWGRE